MRHVRMLGLCLVAVFAVAAIAATSASALPEWGQCYLKGAGGKYTDSNCQHKSSKKSPGEYEWRKNPEVPQAEKEFEGENAGSGGVLAARFFFCNNAETELPEFRVTRQTCAEHKGEMVMTGNELTECEREEDHGEAAGTKEVKSVSVKFGGCKLFGSLPCSNGPNEGEIQVNPLKGSLGYISKSPKEVGVLLTPEQNKGEFARFNCGGFYIIGVGAGNNKLGSFYLTSGCYGACPGATPEEEKHGGYDGVISPITPINTMSTEFTQTFTINSENDENIPSRFEGKHIDLLEAYLENAAHPGIGDGWGAAGEAITSVNHESAGHPAEIKA